MYKYLLITLLTLFPHVSSAHIGMVPDSVEISLLTCSPHDQVYSLYGHTAIRVRDLKSGEDVAVNYGVFDQTKPNFVLRFILGLTDYTMAIIPMEYFFAEYRYYGSSVTEQVISLTSEEKIAIINAIGDNYRPENREYRYNFFYNNCTTKARDIILDNIKGTVSYKPLKSVQEGVTYRQLLHEKMVGYDWCAFGNDVLLGVGSDMNVTQEDRQFLPECLMQDFGSATIVTPDGKKRKLVKEERVILSPSESQLEPMSGFPLSPFCVFGFMFIVCVAVKLLEVKRIHHRIKWFDYGLFFTLGVIGILVYAMLFSEHPTVKVNFLMAVFSPFWIPIILYFDKKKWARYCGYALCGIALAGNFIQDYPQGILFLVLMLIVRMCPLKKI